MRPGRLERAYGALLRILPRGFRERHGPGMQAMFAEGVRSLRPLSRARFVTRSFGDALIQAVALRVPRGPDVETWTDLRIAVRSLGRRPGFTLVVAATLALGIGLSTAVFAFVNGLLLRPLPYAEPQRLVQLSETSPELGTMDLSLPDFGLWRDETRVFDGVFAFDDTSFLLDGKDGARLVEGATVSPGFLSVLGVPVVAGRAFLPAEERPGADAVALVSDRLWASRWGRDPGVVGASVRLSGRLRTVVGVVAPGFHFPEIADVWVPLAFAATADPEDYGYDAIGRMQDGATLRDARAEGERIAARLRATSPATKAGIGTAVYPLRWADVPGGLTVAALAAMAAAVLVLLIACSNVTTLLLARGEERRDELRVRLALGAGRVRIARHVLAECVVLTGLGCLGGVALAAWGGGIFGRLLPAELPYWLDFRPDARVLAWTATASVVCCLLMGGGAAAQSTRTGAARPGSAGHVVGGGRRRLVTVQVGVGVVLVACAGIVGSALRHVGRTEPGLDPQGVLVLEGIVPPWDHSGADDLRDIARRALAAVRAVPSVSEAALVRAVPFVGAGDEVALETNGAVGALPVGVLNAVSGSYFDAMRIPLVRGRAFSEEDEERAAPVAIVSAGLADRLWPGEEPLGRRVRHAAPGARSPSVSEVEPWSTVVGVAGDVRQRGPTRPSRGEIYVPASRFPTIRPTFVARGTAGVLPATADVRAAVVGAAPGIALLEPTTVEDAFRYTLWTERLLAGFLAAFGALAIVLTAVGVHAIVAYAARRREPEMGVRVALGASAATLRRAVLVEGTRLVLPGLVIGGVATLAVSTVAARVLPWLPALDVMPLAVTALAFLVVAWTAALVPATRAARIDPVVALRSSRP